MPKKNERVHLLITLSLFVKVGVFAFKLNIEFVLLAHYYSQPVVKIEITKNQITQFCCFLLPTMYFDCIGFKIIVF